MLTDGFICKSASKCSFTDKLHHRAREFVLVLDMELGYSLLFLTDAITPAASVNIVSTSSPPKQFNRLTCCCYLNNWNVKYFLRCPYNFEDDMYGYLMEEITS